MFVHLRALIWRSSVTNSWQDKASPEEYDCQQAKSPSTFMAHVPTLLQNTENILNMELSELLDKKMYRKSKNLLMVVS